MRVAVIGVGMIGELHARIFDANPQCTLVAVCDIDHEKADRVATALGCAMHTDYRALLEVEELDAVSIATMESFRHEPAVAAARAGLKMLLEKPLGRTLADVDVLVEALAHISPEPAVNFILHADSRFAEMKRIVAAGDIGQVVSCFARRRGTRLGIERLARTTDLLSSTLIHDIDMALSVNATPAERVYAEAVVRQCAGYGSHDAVVATLRFEDGAVALFETSWVLPPNQPEPLDPAFHLIGDAGSVVIEGAARGMQVQREASYIRPDLTHWPVLPDGVGGALKHSLDAFVDAALAGEPPLVGLQQARRAEAVVAAMKRALADERPVRLDEMR